MFEINNVDILNFIDKTKFLFQGNFILNINFKDQKFKNPLIFLEKIHVKILEFTLENKKLFYHSKTFHEIKNFCEIKNNINKNKVIIPVSEENYKKKYFKKKETLVSVIMEKTDLFNKKKFLNIYFLEKLRPRIIKLFNFAIHDSLEIEFPFIFSTDNFFNEKKNKIFDIKTLNLNNFLSSLNTFLVLDLKIFKKLNLLKNTFNIHYIFKKLKIRFFFLQALFIRKRKFSILIICNSENIKKKLKSILELIKFFFFLIFFFNKPKNVIILANLVKKNKISEIKSKIKILSDIKQKKNKKFLGIFIFGLNLYIKKNGKWFIDFLVDNFLLFYKKMTRRFRKNQDFADNLFILKKKIFFSKTNIKKFFPHRFLTFLEIYQIMRFLVFNKISSLRNFFRGLFFKKKNFFFLKQSIYSFIFRKSSQVEIVITNENKKSNIEIAIYANENVTGEFFPFFFFNVENKKKLSLIEIYSSWQIFVIKWDPKKTYLKKRPLLLFPDISYMKTTNKVSIFNKNSEWGNFCSNNLSEENQLIFVFLQNLGSNKIRKLGSRIKKFSFLKVKIILMFFKILQKQHYFRGKKFINNFFKKIIFSKVNSSTMIFIYLNIISFILKEKGNFLKTSEIFLNYALKQNITLKLCPRDKYVFIKCYFYSRFLLK